MEENKKLTTFVAPHHLHQDEERRVAQEISAHRATVSDAAGTDARLSSEYLKRKETGFLSRPGPVVTAIVIAAVIFISIITWFIAHEPVK